MPTTMQEKPTINLILLRAAWFDSVVALPELSEAVKTDAEAITKTLEQIVQISGQWVVNSPSSLEVCLREFNSCEADLTVLAFQVWAEDSYLEPLRTLIVQQPLLVWCYLPTNQPKRPLSFVQVLRFSGPVGTLEGLGTLRNLELDFAFTQGPAGDPRVMKKISVQARAAQVKGALRNARFGLLPARNEQMESTFVDEFRLHTELGPQVQYLSVGKLQWVSSELADSEVQAYLEHLQSSYPLKDVDSADLEKAACLSLGLAHLAQDHKLDVISLNDINPELHRVLGMRPCLYPPLLQEIDAALSLEGDLGAATALFILRCLAGDPLFFVEIWFWDEVENVIVGGHAGVQNPQVARDGCVWISFDYEYAQSDAYRGVHFQFVARAGPVTLLQLRGTPHGWQAIATIG